MKTIWKYDLEVEPTQDLYVPEGAEVLCVDLQASKPKLWCLVETDNPPSKLTILTHGTGSLLDEVGQYLGSYQLYGGALVLHVFLQ